MKQGLVTVLAVGAPLIGDASNVLRERIHSCLDAGDLQIILDFQSVAYIDSAALGILLTSSRLARHKGGAIKLVHVTGVCYDVFVATRLEQVLEIYPDTYSAQQSFL